MQLGTRWPMGSEPPSGLSAEVIAAVRKIEKERLGFSTQRRWTLTWLEGRPILELDPPAHSDDFITITVNPADGAVTISRSGSGDEWVEDEL